MVTDRRRVQSYLSDSIYDSLLSYSQVNNCSISAAIEQLLEDSLHKSSIISGRLKLLENPLSALEYNNSW